MRELGNSSKEEHQKIYDLATKSADLIISVGPETTKYFDDKSKKFTYWWQAAKFLKDQIKGEETILVKGSQNTIFLEELVKSILKNPSDSKKLCRQSPYWLKVKAKFKL
jgi:UDP-N-acetylmuramyl pentapeptide synthase